MQTRGVALASRCDCCSSPHEETFDHIFATGEIAFKVWRAASMALGVYCM